MRRLTRGACSCSVPDGRTLGLAAGNILNAMIQNPITGTLRESGGATTAPFTVPANLSGSTF